MPLIKSGSKKAISSNIREFHTGKTYARTAAKFGKGKADKQAVAVAMSQARRYRAEGGGIYERPDEVLGKVGTAAIQHVKDTFDPWKKDESGAYVADKPLGSSYGKTPEIEKSSGEMLGGMMDLASTVTPTGLAKKAIFLGPSAMKALRATQTMHPTVGAHLLPNERRILEQAKQEGPEALAAAQRGIQNNRDAIAAIDLKNNPEPDPLRDRMRFALTGTARNAANQPVKELHDLGISLEPSGGIFRHDTVFHIKHPSGDLHKEFGIPPVKFDPSLTAGEGVTSGRNNQITLGGRPWIKKDMEKAKAVLVHELDHVMQKRDRLPTGSSLVTETVFPQMYRQGLGRDAPSDAAMRSSAMFAHAFGLEAMPEKELEAAFDTYRRAAGEVSAENARGRRAKGYKYLHYPEDTEHTGRGNQIIRYQDDLERRDKELKFADGGSIKGLIEDYERSLDQLHPDTKFEMGKKLLKKKFLKSIGVDDVVPTNDMLFPGYRYDDGPTPQQMERDDLNRERPRIDELQRLEGIMEKNLQKPVGPGIQPKGAWPVAMAGGGNPYAPQPKGSDISGYMSRKMIHKAVQPGMLKSPIPGRTDKLPISVPAGSYVIPADIVSGLGQGNSDAGNAILGKMFKSGPLGMKAPARVGASAKRQTAPLLKGAKISAKATGFADGGGVEEVPVIAAGGEYILHPEQVMSVGGGDMDRGHEILDAFVLHSRKQLVKTLKKLPGPAKD